MTTDSNEAQDPRQDRTGPPQARSPRNGPTFAEPQPYVLDLSTEIVSMIPKATDERVTCRWISGHNYRCNWWGPQSTASYDNPAMAGLTVTTHRVRRSQWLHVIKTDKGLVIEPGPRAPR
jgi:hypothetical protein